MEDGDEDGEGELELGVEGVEWCVLEEEEGLDLVEEGWGEGCFGSGVCVEVWGGGRSGGGGVGMRGCHVHSTFVLGWGVVEWSGVEVVEIVTGERLVFCKWLWGLWECGLGFWGVV